MNGLMETLDFAFLAEAVPAAEAGLSALDVVGMILATIGLVFFLGAAVGLYRFPDFYTRMHAAGKGDTLSSLLILAGFALITLEDFSAAGGLLVVKVLAIVLFSVTLIGIPVAVVLAMVLSIAWCMGFVAVCQATGDRFPGIQGRGAWPAFLLGTTLMAIVWMFPYVGPVVLTLLALPAAGAALTTRFGGTGRPPAASA